MAFWRPEEELAELDEKVVLTELLQLKTIFTKYLKDVRRQPYILEHLHNQIIKLLKDATKHNELVAIHSRKVLERLQTLATYDGSKRQKVSFLTKEEEAVIRTTLSIESALFILANHYAHFSNMEIQHESHLGQPRQSGYTPFLLGRQMLFIVGELDKIIDAVKHLISIEESIKRQSA